MDLQLYFECHKQPSIYTIDRISELLKNLKKQEAISEYAVSIWNETLQKTTELLDADLETINTLADIEEETVKDE